MDGSHRAGETGPPAAGCANALRASRRLLLCLLLTAPATLAGVVDDWRAAVDRLRRPAGLRRARVADLALPLAAGRLEWRSGRARLLTLVLDGDSLFVVELRGKGRLELELADTLEQVAVRATLGRHPLRRRLDEALLVLSRLPAGWDRLDWRPARGPLPLLPVPRLDRRERLAGLHPDHPFLLPRPAPGDPPHRELVWLDTGGDGLRWVQAGGQARLERQLHAGSRRHVPVTAVLEPPADADATGAPWRVSGDPSWLPPTLAAPAAGVDSLACRLAGTPGGLDWTMDLWPRHADRPLWLLLDPGAALGAADWVDGRGVSRPAPGSRGGGAAADGPWLLVDAGPADARLRLSGHTPRALVLREGPGRRRAAGTDWFPVLPWWEDPAPLAATFLAPAADEAGARPRRSSLGAPQALLPEERPALELGAGATLHWTPYRDRAAFQVPAPARVRRFTGELENLDLPRERLVRPPGHEAPAEPVDLVQGQDTLTVGMLGEERVAAELSAAARLLHDWLGPSPAPVALRERLGPAPDRATAEERVVAHDQPPDGPLEVAAHDLRAAAPASRLARLETLARGWWPPPTGEAAVQPRWIRAGAARACALRLLEDLQGPQLARDLRQDALERELAAFRANASASLPALGERAEGVWRWDGTADRLAWRFALLLEHLRWRLRDPATGKDGEWRALVAALHDRLAAPVEARAPLKELAAAVSESLAERGALDRAGFPDARSVWQWLDTEWRRAAYPQLTVRPGRVMEGDGWRLALRVAWAEPPAPCTRLPVLLRTTETTSTWLLNCTAVEEQFVLPVDPGSVLGLEVAPGASLPARIHVK